MTKLKCAIIGSGNIGSDLMIKIKRNAKHLELAAMVGIDPSSEGLERAKRMGVATTAEGIEGLLALPDYKDIQVVFDATSAGAHLRHEALLRQDGKKVIDLTPAAIGPFNIPAVNGDETIDAPNVNMVTCGGQATIPMVHAVARASKRTIYGEIVASISSRSAGPGTRANIDEFTETTSRAIEKLGGAEKGRALIILNPAEPPLIMRDTVFVLSQGGTPEDIERSIAEMVKSVQAYVPGYRLKQKVQFEVIGDNSPVRIPGIGRVSGLKTTIFLEVEGAAHYLPAYAGNLDIMTSAALVSADHWAEKRVAGKADAKQLGKEGA
ncbi:MAG: acetaldehyde dehydrogenase (acetylating) [Thioclava marina]|uniref:acetaldehyde dehydrogenase (acetylating) n=1 Tax=Thioclava marina TaxID=1915077 RepID=UPI0019BB7447|nr:acetaldehyde dehydrogenase (acetylating) [Thioclava marina]MBC7143933.1 acetaldehyde dehydrogenase (acetylating) [Thioclava marina]